MASSEPRWHPEAVAEALEAREWYRDRSSRAALGFLLALRAAVGVVTAAPERWPVDRHGCRRYVFPSRYPYTLVYRLRDGVEVVAVAHQRRRPGYWSAR